MTTTLVSVTKLPDQNATGDTRNGSASEVVKYQVKFSDSGATGTDARNATGVPLWGAALVTATLGTVNLYVSQKSATRVRSAPELWDVDVTYSTLDIHQQPAQPSGFSSGDKYGVQVTAQGLPFQTQLTIDKSGKAITNSNDEPIEPALTETKYDQQINVVFWTDKMDQTTIDACIGKANSGSVTMTIGASTWTYAVNTFVFNNYSWSVNYTADGARVFQVTFEFIYRKDTWQYKVPNMSYYGLDSGGTLLLPFVDPKTKQPYSSPRYIDAAVPTGIIATGGSVVLLSFDIVSTTSFSTLLTGVP